MDPVKRIHATNLRQARLMKAATYASVSMAAALVALKLYAWQVTDSVAILSSLIDSALDAFASLVTMIAVSHSLTPADAEHRFGHGKAEPLAALMQSGFIAGSAIVLFFQAVKRIIEPAPIEQTTAGILVMCASIVGTIALVSFQWFVIKRSGSVAIRADSLHYKGDLFANIAVIATLVISGTFGITIFDPIFGLAISGYIMWSAWNVGHEALNMLMDRELPDEDRQKIKNIALAYPDVLSIHDLRTRRAGPDVFIQMHLEFNGALTLNRVHSVADAVENEIMEAFPGAEVLVHEDPAPASAFSDDENNGPDAVEASTG